MTRHPPTIRTPPIDSSTSCARSGRYPGPQREALVLIEWLGYSAEEAGPLLGIQAASVRGRLHRAREGLRQR